VLSDATVRDLVAKRAWGDLQSAMRRGDNPNMQSLNHSFVKAIKAEKITVETSVQYSYDRSHLMELLRADGLTR
ncbi:MAG: hypothetical protein ACRERX_23005, partial [Pseudomonas sp.]